MISSTLLTLIVIPAIFGLAKGLWLPSEHSPESASVQASRPSGLDTRCHLPIKPVDFR